MEYRVVEESPAVGSTAGKLLTVAFIGNHLPRQCGIATFTTDLCDAVTSELGDEKRTLVVAATNVPATYSYPERVRFEIRQNVRADYRQAADFINFSDTSIVCLQHEYGIFGGDDGHYILSLLRNLKKPVVTTLHTILQNPSDGQRELLSEIAGISAGVVVMNRMARQMLEDVYGIFPDKIFFIPHGVPDVPFVDPNFYKSKFAVDGRDVILTFGLMSPSKGLEYVLEALPSVVKKYPEVAYIILGATHPEVRKTYGEDYRLSLQRMVEDGGLTDHVIFHNHFVTLEELCEFLCAADIYVTPYLNAEQIVSGTLAYAAATGKAIISTPYLYAQELLADDRGILVDFRDSKAIAAALDKFLRNRRDIHQYRKRLYEHTRSMVWKEVARAYLSLFARIRQEYLSRPVTTVLRRKTIPITRLPEPDLSHLIRMTDDTGLIQHCLFAVPRRHTGYCVDDNARALIVATMNYAQFQNEESLELIDCYLSFLQYCEQEDGWFHNFVNYDRSFADERGSEDCVGRALWALGYIIQQRATTESTRAVAKLLFDRSIGCTAEFKHPRPKAFALIGCHHYLKRLEGALDIRHTAEKLAQSLVREYEEASSDEWQWFGDSLTYDNGRLPKALYLAYITTGEKKWLDVAEKTQAFLTENLIRGGHLSLAGNRGWLKKGKRRSRFAQQPIDAASMVDLYHAALAATGDSKYKELLRLAFDWFLGKNDLSAQLYDFSTGGCSDGLEATGPNRNQGAEATVSFLMALHTTTEVMSEVDLITTTPLADFAKE